MSLCTISDPKKIYRTETGPSVCPSVTYNESPQVGRNIPYIRIDLYAKIEAENCRLRKLMEAMLPTVGTEV